MPFGDSQILTFCTPTNTWIKAIGAVMAGNITSPHSPSGEATLTVIWIFIAIGGVMILARLYLRLWINRQKLQLSDMLICLAWCAAAITGSIDIVLFSMKALRKDVDFFLSGYYGDKERAFKVSRDTFHESSKALRTTG
jgi:hypothetical protein